VDLNHFARHFVILLAIFVTLNSTTFSTLTHPFFNWYSVQSFLIDTLLSHFSVAIAQPFYDFAKPFFIATLLSHFLLLIAQLFFFAAVLSHFHCYIAPSFPTTKVC
jgi:hypothetical protein